MTREEVDWARRLDRATRHFEAALRALEAHKAATARHRYDRDTPDRDRERAMTLMRLNLRVWRWAVTAQAASSGVAKSVGTAYGPMPWSVTDWLAQQYIRALKGFPIEALNRRVGGRRLTPHQENAIAVAIEYIVLVRADQIPDPDDPELTVRTIFGDPKRGTLLAAGTLNHWLETRRQHGFLARAINNAVRNGDRSGPPEIAKRLLESHARRFHSRD